MNKATGVTFSNRLRGVVKLCVPYFMEAAYIRRRYGVDPTPKWYDKKRASSRMGLVLLQFLPYGLIGPRCVAAPPDPVVGKTAFSIMPIPFEILKDVRLDDALVEIVHEKVLAALYPREEMADGRR